MSGQFAAASENPLAFTQEFTAPWLEDLAHGDRPHMADCEGLRLCFSPDIACLATLQEHLNDLSGKINLVKITLERQKREKVIDKLLLMNAAADCLDIAHASRHFYLESKVNIDYITSNLLYVLNHMDTVGLVDNEKENCSKKEN